MAVPSVFSDSGHHIYPFPGLGAYTATKYSVTVLCRSILDELNATKSKIKVTVRSFMQLNWRWLIYEIIGFPSILELEPWFGREWDGRSLHGARGQSLVWDPPSQRDQQRRPLRFVDSTKRQCEAPNESNLRFNLCVPFVFLTYIDFQVTELMIQPLEWAGI